MREEEVVSGIRYRDNTVQLDLNIPVEDSYAQHGYSNYGYGGEPYSQAEIRTVSQTIPTPVTAGAQLKRSRGCPTPRTFRSLVLYM
ncbi:hypothetical protein HanHA300_Chr06g0213751 [Helianthus annuus]|nr:hypothetical protein HanHA300_Chr06g0213751 [Helianthus annuus]KAJ0573689.1 hypothetical protein HanHA89_Chr06g0229541 [Helianthus annuus]